MFRKISLMLKKYLTIVLLSMINISIINSTDNIKEVDIIPKPASPVESLNISSGINIKKSDIFDIQITKNILVKPEKIELPKYFTNTEIDKSYIYMVKTFNLPENFYNKKTTLALNDIRGDMQLFLNKKLIFKKSFYSSDFNIDISKEIIRNKAENELVLIFNTINFEKSTLGLKSIKITALPDVHHVINDPSSDISGLFITAEDINFMKKSANIIIKTKIKNDATEDITINYLGILENLKNNKKTVIADNQITLKPDEIHYLNLEKKIGNLDLWSFDKPNLYKYYSIIKLNGDVIDTEKTTTGFKKLEYIYNKEENKKGIFLNNEHTFLNGFNYSYINDWQFSDNIPEQLTDFTIKLIKAANANLIRLTDDMINEAVVRSCERHGLLIMCHVKNKDFLSQIINKYKNSCSLVFVEMDKKDLTFEKINEFKKILKKGDIGKSVFLGAITPDFALSESLDWIGTKSGRYYKKNIEQTKPIIELNDLNFNLARNPSYKPETISKDQKGFFLDNTAYSKLLINEFNRYHSKNINSSSSNTKIWSGLILNSFNDYMINDKEINYRGTVDIMKIKKEIYHIYSIMQGSILKKHETHIINHWNYNDNENIEVLVASNCDIVKLYINEKLIKTNRTPINKYLFKFDNVKWQKGTVKAVGYKNFKKVSLSEKRSFEKPDKIKLSLETLSDTETPDPSDIIILNIKITDAEDVPCIFYNDEIELTIEGPCNVITNRMKEINPIKDNHYILKINSGESRVIIQTSDGSGIIKIKASGTELKTNELNIELKK
ncbi:MAG: DUF4982 domain-containing protein [Spirochaetes bacterium]|nr:DUF4982 domain-containing protein [Spirochaetota bacterium]